MADKQPKAASTTNAQIKKADKVPVVTTTAGEFLAKTWAYGNTGLQLIQELDDVVAALANIDFGQIPGCKSVKKLPGPTATPNEIDEFFKDLYLNAGGCAPFVQDIINAQQAVANDNDPNTVGKVITALTSTIEFLLTPEKVFPKCVDQQIRRFIQVIPVQYFLLILMSKLAQQVADFDTITKKIETPCGETFEQLKVFKDRIPQIDIPQIPTLPYINIPDLTDYPSKIFGELACIGLCSLTTTLIQRIIPALDSINDSLAEYFFTEDYEFQSFPFAFRKISIIPYLTPAAFEGARDNRLIPRSVTDEQIVDYIQKIQNREDVKQEEFIFLFLGQAKCEILLKIQDQPETQGTFGFTSDAQISAFFNYLGSFVNFLDIIEDSKSEVCEPDPCDLKPNEIEGIIASVNDLCALLNPQLGLPPLPLGAIMDASGVNDFIVNNTYESYKTIPTLNRSYQLYINNFFTDALAVVQKILLLDQENSFYGVSVGPSDASLSRFILKKVTFLGVELITIEKDKAIIKDDKINFAKVNNSIQKYWLENEDLTFANDELIISNFTVGDIKTIEQDLEDFARRYLEASYPFAVLNLIGESIPQNFEFLNFYDDYSATGQIFADVNNTSLNTNGITYNPTNATNVKFNGYLKYTQQILRNQLTELQKGSTVDVNDEETLQDMLKFSLAKLDFGL